MNDLPDDVICNISIYADDTTLYSKCDPVTDLWQQLELASKLFFFNWDSPHARLNSHYEAWSYKKRSTEKLQDTENLFRKNLQLKDVC